MMRRGWVMHGPTCSMLPGLGSVARVGSRKLPWVTYGVRDVPVSYHRTLRAAMLAVELATRKGAK